MPSPRGSLHALTNSPYALEDIALKRLISLYTAWDKPAKVAEWRARQKGFIRDWLIVAAPLPKTPGAAKEPVDQEQISGEANLRPREGDRISLGGKELVWKKHHVEAVVDFNAFLGKETPHAVAYAVCYVVADKEQYVQLTFGIDGQAKLYLNSKEL